MKKIMIAAIMMAACTAHAQNPLSSQKYNIDTAITGKTASKSISPATVGTQMKGICDAIYTYFMKYTDSARLVSTGSIGAPQIKAPAPAAGQVLGWNGSGLAWVTNRAPAYYKAGFDIIKGVDSAFSRDTTFLTCGQYIDTAVVFNQVFSTGGVPDNFSLSMVNTATWTGGTLNFAGNGNVLSDYIRYNDTTMMENVILRAAIVYNVKNVSTDSGIEIGFNSVNNAGAQHNLRMGYVYASNLHQGQIYVNVNSTTYTSGTNNYIGTPNTNISAGDTLIYTLQPTVWAATVTVFNKTKGWTISGNVSLGAAFYNAANCSINHIGGSYSVLNFNYSILYPHNTFAIFRGNSIFGGQCSSSSTLRVANKVIGAANIKVGSGGADVASMVAGTGKELQLMHPKVVVLGDGAGGGNDVFNGYPYNQIMSTIIKAYNNVLSAGAIPLICTASPRYETDMRTLNALLKTTFPSANIIDVYSALHDTTTPFGIQSYFSCDGTHWTDSANAVVTKLIDSNYLYKKLWRKATLDENLLSQNSILNDIIPLRHLF